MSTLKLPIEAGALIRNRIISQIKNYCWQHDIGLQVDEDRGLLSSNYRLTLTGDESMLRIVNREISRWVDAINKENQTNE